MASKINIGANIGISGEKEYRQALKNIASEQKVLTSEMKLASSQYQENTNSLEALNTKNVILTKQIDNQTEKVKIYSKAVEDSTEKQRIASENVEKYKNELSKAQSELDDMKKSSDTTTEALDKQQKIVSDLEKKLTLSENAYEKNTQKINQYQTSLNLAETDLNKMNTELKKNDEYLAEATNSTDKCATSLDKYGKEVKDATDKSQDFGNKSSKGVEQLSMVLAGAGIVQGLEEIAGALLDCTEASGEFETGLTKISTVADTSKKSMSTIKGEILALSGELGQGANGLTDSVYNAISASVDTASAVEFTEKATKLAVAGFTDATTSVDVLTTALNAYGLSVDEVSNVSDMLIVTQNLGKTTVDELASSMGKVIPIAGAYNVNMANLSTAYAIATKNGIATAEATTYIKSMLNELGDSGSDVGKILQNQTGKSFSQLMSSGKSLGEVLKIVGDSVNNDKANFNSLWASSEAGVGALSILTDGVEGFNGFLGQMTDSVGLTEKAFETMSNTEEYASKRMLSSLENLKIAVGDELNPALKNLEETGAEAFEWATDFVQDNPEVVSLITALSLAIGVFTVGTIGASVAMTAFNAVLALNPAIAITAGIVGLTTALVTLGVASKDATTDSEALVKSADDYNKKLQESVTAREESITSMQSEIGFMQTLGTELTTLNEKEALSSSEKSRMNEIVTKLNTSMPNLSLKINEQTGKIEGNTKAIQEAINKNLEWYKVQSANEQLTAIYKEQADAELEVYKIDQEIAEQKEINAKATEEVNKMQEEYNSTLSHSKKEQDAYIDSSSKLGVEVVNSKTAIEELTEQRNKLTESQSTQADQVELLNGFIQENTEVTKENSDAVDESSKVYNMYGQEVINATTEMTTAMATLNEKFGEAQVEAEKSLTSQMGLFQAAEEQSSISVAEMTKNLQSQTEAFNQYKEDILLASDLVSKGLMDEGLLGYIESFGMQGAGSLHELVTAAETDKEAFSGLMNEWTEMSDAKDNLATSMADIQTGYSQSMKSLGAIVEDGNEEIRMSTVDLANGIGQNNSDLEEKFISTYDRMMVSANSKVSDGATALQTSSATAMAGVISAMNTSLNVVDGKSLEAQKVGNSFVTGFTQALSDGTLQVSTAMQSMMDNAINNADFSGFINALDKKLGDALD